jgi:inosine/xanthosine triphosphatase
LKAVKTIVVASHNPVKARAVLEGFQRMFPHQVFELRSVAADSQVSDQPFSDEETQRGAANRAMAASRLEPTADYWVGIEGGIEVHAAEMAAYAWVVILGRDLSGKSRTGTFYLPPQVAELIHQGIELGEADDIVFGRSNSKQENGAIGLLTGDVIDRVQLYEHAVILALVPFKNPRLYS